MSKYVVMIVDEEGNVSYHLSTGEEIRKDWEENSQNKLCHKLFEGGITMMKIIEVTPQNEITQQIWTQLEAAEKTINAI